MTGPERSSRFSMWSCVTAIALTALFAWAPGSSDAAWDGTQSVELGDTISAQFVGAPLTQAHDYAFYAPAGTVISTQITVVDRGAGGGLVPELSVFTGAGELVDVGAARVGNTIRKFAFADAGPYRFRVRAQAGTGVYKLATKVKFPALSVSSATGKFTFVAPAGALLTAQVRPSKASTAKPVVTGLTYLGGAVALGAAAGTKRIIRLGLPADGVYTLAVDPVTAGQSVDARITIAFPKPPNSWRFGVIESVPGLPDQNRTKWLASPHADHSAMAFSDWNDTPAQQVPATCARCHTSSGYRDYIGDDGTAAGVVDAAAPIGQVVDCDACHNDAASALTSVTFPSGLSVGGLGKEARCMVCHQGRESTVSVEAKITAAKADNPALDDDTVSAKISFLNVHYFAAGASLYGREAAGAYEYAEPGGAASDLFLTNLPQRRQYDRKFTHVASKDTCIECHDPHTLEVRVEDCATCHVNRLGNPVATRQDMHEIRMAGTVNDFDGDGDAKEGVAQEIGGLQTILYAAMQDYATKVAGKPLAYDGAAYPYFFEMGTANKYPNWTARLLRAAYNYQYSMKDPGAFAHNGKFIIEFLYDSIDDLNAKLSALAAPSPVANFAGLERNDPGHFDSAAEAYRHWEADGDEEISASCSRCHSIEGFKFVAEYGIDQTIPAPLISGLSCETCHEQGTSFAPQALNPNADKKPARIHVPNVKFPYPSTATSAQISAVTIVNGAKGSAAQDDSFICMTCHRARESTLTLDAADVGGLVTSWTLSAKNSHYLPAGAIQYGGKAMVGYQYAGRTYAQRYDHDQGYTRPYPAPTWERARCEFCHMQDGSHGFRPDVASDTCTYCHITATGVDDLVPAFRAQDNYDNDPATKPKAEVAAFAARLLAAMLNYSKTAKANNVSGADWTMWYAGDNPAATASAGFYKDKDHDGALSVAELASANAAKFDSRMYRAAFNVRLWFNEPGAWAHNPKYILQILYDSIIDLGQDATGLTRPI